MSNETQPLRELSIGFDEALARLPEALKAEGFGVITEIDMQATLAQKLGVSFRRYRVLGACNPRFAHAALERDLGVGVLLPCNVILYESDAGRAVVGAVDPRATLGARSSDPALVALAGEVADRLGRAVGSLS